MDSEINIFDNQHKIAFKDTKNYCGTLIIDGKNYTNLLLNAFKPYVKEVCNGIGFFRALSNLAVSENGDIGHIVGIRKPSDEPLIVELLKGVELASRSLLFRAARKNSKIMNILKKIDEELINHYCKIYIRCLIPASIIEHLLLCKKTPIFFKKADTFFLLWHGLRIDGIFEDPKFVFYTEDLSKKNDVSTCHNSKSKLLNHMTITSDINNREIENSASVISIHPWPIHVPPQPVCIKIGYKRIIIGASAYHRKILNQIIENSGINLRYTA